MEMNVARTVEHENRVEELMDKLLQHKLAEFESRLELVENEANQANKQLTELAAKTEVVSKESQELHRETIRRFVEFAEKLAEISREVKLIEEALHGEEKAIERIREHENDAVENVKAWEGKILKNINRQITAKKALEAMMRRLLTGKNKRKIENVVKTAGNSTKARAALVNAVLRDKKLRSKLVADVLAGTRGKLRREKVTAAVARVAEKKVLKTVKPKVRKAAKKAAKAAVQVEASKV